MFRLLLILALVCTGLAPGATCLHAAAKTGVGAEVSCGVSCCGPSCCCAVKDESAPLPDAPTPAMPPRGVDLAPTFLLSSAPFSLAWDEESGHPPLEARYADRIAPREPKAVQRMICRWIT